MVKVPPNDPAEFLLPVLAAFNGRPPGGRRFITVEPLFAKHSQEGYEERGGETCEEDGLDLDYRVGRTGPLGESGNVCSEGGVVEPVKNKAKEGSSLIAGIWLELGVELDDKCGGYCREQTSLYPRLVRVHRKRIEN